MERNTRFTEDVNRKMKQMKIMNLMKTSQAAGLVVVSDSELMNSNLMQEEKLVLENVEIGGKAFN